MNTLREKDGYPPIYPTVQDSEVPVLVTNQGRLMVSQKPAGHGIFGVMCADSYVKLPYFKSDQVRISNTSGKEVALSKTWKPSILGSFDADPYVDGQTINGVNGWEGNGVTTPDSNDETRTPVMEILQGRRSVYINDKITKQGESYDGVVPDGTKVSSLFRPRLASKLTGLGLYDGSKNLVVGIYSKDGFLGTTEGGVDTDSAIKIDPNSAVRLEIVFAPSVGFIKYYAFQNEVRYLIKEGAIEAIKAENLSYSSYRVGAEGEGALVDEFRMYLFNPADRDFEVLPSSSSTVFALLESTDELMVKNLGSIAGDYLDNLDPIYLAGSYEES